MLFERFQIQMFPAMRTSLVSQTRSAIAGMLQHLEGAGVFISALYLELLAFQNIKFALLE